MKACFLEVIVTRGQCFPETSHVELGEDIKSRSCHQKCDCITPPSHTDKKKILLKRRVQEEKPSQVRNHKGCHA